MRGFFLMPAAVSAASIASSAHGGEGNVLPVVPKVELMEMTEFFVCDAAVEGMNGRYIRADELHADRDTPVFVRDDDEDQSNDGGVVNPNRKDSEFRLFRHGGFWMFADFGQWPPQTHYRCDPTRRNSEDVDFLANCGINLPTPPLAGYTSSSSELSAAPLQLHDKTCSIRKHAEL